MSLIMVKWSDFYSFSVQPGQSKIQRQVDRKPTGGFFAKRDPTVKPKPPRSEPEPAFLGPRRQNGNGFFGKSEERGLNGAKNGSVTNGSTVNGTAEPQEVPKYQSPVRRLKLNNEAEGMRSLGVTSRPKEPSEEEKAAEKAEAEKNKKSFMPAFIKPHHVQQMMDRNTVNQPVKYQPPQFQARSGFPGQNSNAPSPVDRVNSARNMHLRRNQEKLINKIIMQVVKTRNSEKKFSF